MSRLPRVIRTIALAAISVGFAIPAFAQMTPMIGLGGMKQANAAAQPEIEGDGKADATLTLDLHRYDFAGTKALNQMYMPSSVVLSPNKPPGVTKEPQYNGTPRYATVTIGNGTPDQFVIAVDEAEGKEPKIYIDLNGDGDLTNDGTGDWQTKIASTTGGLPEYTGTYTFAPGWHAPDGSNKVGQFALNFYWQPGRGQLNYYSASSRVGKINLGGQSYDVALIDNNCDGVFNRLYDHTKPIVVTDRPTRPVWLMLDGNPVDIRGTFQFGGMNYLATVSDDGSELHMTPTFKVIQVPRDVPDMPAMIGAGKMAPDFEAVEWNQGQTAYDPSNRFKLSDFRGKKIVVVDMWATWCTPCMRSIPHLNKVAEAVAGQDVEVIALNTSDDEIPFAHFATGQYKEYKFTLARDPAGRDQNENTIAHKLYGVTGIPATFIIDKSGKIVATVSGYTEGDTKIEQVLKGLGVKMD